MTRQFCRCFTITAAATPEPYTAAQWDSSHGSECGQLWRVLERTQRNQCLLWGCTSWYPWGQFL